MATSMNAEQAWQKYVKLWEEYLVLQAKSDKEFKAYRKSSDAARKKLNETARAFKEYERLTENDEPA